MGHAYNEKVLPIHIPSILHGVLVGVGSLFPAPPSSEPSIKNHLWLGCGWTTTEVPRFYFGKPSYLQLKQVGNYLFYVSKYLGMTQLWVNHNWATKVLHW